MHSPFMFNLILNVIRDRGRRFAYPVELEKGLGHREKKVFRLVSRLVRHLNVKHIVCWGTDASKVGDYLNAIGSDVKVGINEPVIASNADFVFIGRNARNYLPGDYLVSGLLVEGNKQKCIIITDIYKSAFAGRLWRQLGEKATVRVDMMWYGILFFDEKLQKGRYNLII